MALLVLWPLDQAARPLATRACLPVPRLPLPSAPLSCFTLNFIALPRRTEFLGVSPVTILFRESLPDSKKPNILEQNSTFLFNNNKPEISRNSKNLGAKWNQSNKQNRLGSLGQISLSRFWGLIITVCNFPPLTRGRGPLDWTGDS